MKKKTIISVETQLVFLFDCWDKKSYFLKAIGSILRAIPLIRMELGIPGHNNVIVISFSGSLYKLMDS